MLRCWNSQVNETRESGSVSKQSLAKYRHSTYNPGIGSSLGEWSAIRKQCVCWRNIPIALIDRGVMLNLLAYLERIGYSGSTEPSAETLRALQRAHMFAVPFENLDIHLGRPIVCDEDRFLHKIINERRGGFCYELNGAFSALLRALGFQVTLLSARVAGADGDTDGPDFDHLTLRVDLPGSTNHGLTAEVPWLADVGFGEGFLEPLRPGP